LAKENDFLRQENKILRSKLGKRVPLTETDRRTLVRYGMPLKDRLREVISIVCPETLLAWNRRMKRRKWTCDNTPTYYTLFFIHLGTRRVQLAGCTPQPEASWMQQQARNFSLLVAENAVQPSYLIHDRDAAFLPLDQVLRPTGIKVIQTPPQSPMCNAYAKRFVRETRETLDQLILLGEGHLRQVLKKIEHHHNQQRPHQRLDNVIPLAFEYTDQPAPPATVHCDTTLGGLLNHYYAESVAA
jgi:transposase InsO family protein